MLTLTDSAKDALQRTLERSDLTPGKHLRLAVPPLWTGEGDFGIVIDSQGAHDQVVTCQDRILLLVDTNLAQRLANSVLDFKVLPSGGGFTLDVY